MNLIAGVWVMWACYAVAVVFIYRSDASSMLDAFLDAIWLVLATAMIPVCVTILYLLHRYA